ncbi:MAG: hypothetical protein MUF50_01525 [Planctomycetes bacterium]|jgi:1-acyl-sn-glycerol-3-phosphate acyltransferase|nr:hypothetical protein [Planctomycetota bacterium]
MKKIISLSGSATGKNLRKWCENRIKNFQIEPHGLGYLKELQKQPFLIVANHLTPRERLAEKFNITPDAFVISYLVNNVNNQHLSIMQRSDDGYWLNNRFGQYLQKEIFWPFAKGFVEGAGNIPIRKNPGSFNRDFVVGANKAKKEKRPMLIFPEGCWYDDFNVNDPKRIIQPGAAFIAQKFGLKILPAYLKGAHSWVNSQEIVAAFGESFSPVGMAVEDVCQKIKNEIGNLSFAVS